MPEGQVIPVEQIEAASPYELRVDGAKDVPESDVRAALASGDMGFLHSFTTGSAVDGPGIRVVAWTSGCMWRCRYCHNPDTWKMTNGIPVSVAQATAELRKYRARAEVDVGRPDGERRRAADAAPVRAEAVRRRARDGRSHRARYERLLRRPGDRRRPRDDRSGDARPQDLGS